MFSTHALTWDVYVHQNRCGEKNESQTVSSIWHFIAMMLNNLQQVAATTMAKTVINQGENNLTEGSHLGPRVLARGDIYVNYSCLFGNQSRNTRW